jgi:hypothetical protein
MKIKIIAFAIALLSIFITTTPLLAQTDSVPVISTTATVDFMSRYIWRGEEYGKAASVQPGLSATWKGLTLGAWGAYTFTGPGIQESDFYLSKDFGPLTLAVWDYWSFCDTSATDFLNYSENSTSHLLEFQALISGGEHLPFNILGSYFFYGADTSKSSYFELQYQYSFGSSDLLLFAGFQAKGDYYASKANFVNIGCTISKELAVSDRWSLPVNVSLIVNPDRKNVYLVAGLTF